MGGGKKSKAPPAPNYSALATQDAAAQKDTANLITQQNRPTQNNPFGSMTWQKDAAGNWTQNEVWDPRVMAGYDQAFDMKNTAMKDAQNAKFQDPGKVADYQNTAGDIGNFNNQAGDIGNFNNTAGDINDYQNNAGPVAQFDPNSGKMAADAMYNSYMSRAGKEQSDQKAQMQTQLRQQGLQPGTEAYDRAYKNLLTAQGDVNAKANFDSQVLGGNEARQNYSSLLGGQQQSWNQGVGDYQATLAGQGQRFDQLAQGYDKNLAGQDQRFSQQNQSFQNNLSAQDQRYQQGLGGYNANLAAQGQRHQQGLADYQARMAGQDQNYKQADANYSRAWDAAGAANNMLNSQYRPTFSGFSGATGYNPADMSGAAQAQYNAKMGGYNTQQGKKGSGINAGMSMMGNILG